MRSRAARSTRPSIAPAATSPTAATTPGASASPGRRTTSRPPWTVFVLMASAPSSGPVPWPCPFAHPHRTEQQDRRHLMAKLIYDTDIDRGALDGQRIAVIGYGSQGEAHA